MHQPVYKEPGTGEYRLPWVRLHALRGYTDLAVLAEKYPAFKQTMNITPSLLIQLEEYVQNPNIQDHFLELTKKNAGLLRPEEKMFILRNFFMNNLERVIRPHPRYNELYQKRGHAFSDGPHESVSKRFTPQDILDLQVLFNLMWFGFSAAEMYPRIHELVKKGRNFTEEEKQEVLALQWQVMREVIARLKKIYRERKIELTTTPFYHPILPLLAKESEDDPGFSWPHDARWHVENARELFKRIFDEYPAGMWPAEGSVSVPAARMFQEAGVQWIATDEEILMHSLDQKAKREEELYQPHWLETGKGSIVIFFRDKTISDLIGFGYHRMRQIDAVNDLIGKLEQLHKSLSQSPGEANPIVSIILDGENPWEHYPDGGKEFLNLLAERLSRHPGLKTTTFSDYLKTDAYTKKVLPHLYSGSWIHHNFDIWYGHAEDFTAWKYVRDTRNHLSSVESTLDGETRKNAWNEIYMAEASDWFWWYGNEFFTESAEIFDTLFRSHLRRVYHLIGGHVPDFVKHPIKTTGRKECRTPYALIQPVIDGKITDYYEWIGSAVYHEESLGGAMVQTDSIFRKIHYGFSLWELFIRLDYWLPNPNEASGYEIMIHLNGKEDFDLRFPLENPNTYELLQVGGAHPGKVDHPKGQIAGRVGRDGSPQN
ncbi:MAG: hypothetical protein HY586_02185, partial [Candidatus Omnitrophica bacterium]|nr:hypothetical protein [Candidatus Omnitrophota bacterium]